MKSRWTGFGQLSRRRSKLLKSREGAGEVSPGEDQYLGVAGRLQVEGEVSQRECNRMRFKTHPDAEQRSHKDRRGRMSQSEREGGGRGLGWEGSLSGKPKLVMR